MNSPAPAVSLTVCGDCHNRFVPTEGPCPRCGSSDLSEVSVPAKGTVLAATELLYPPEGWPAPHVVALVELADSVRLLVSLEALPAPGEAVGLRPGGRGWAAQPPAPGAGRGEGDSPRRRVRGASFEPPR